MNRGLKGEGLRKKRTIAVVSLIVVGAFLGLVTITSNNAKAQGWNILEVEYWNRVGWWSSIAVDSNGYPHISYYLESGRYLKYVKWTGQGWHDQTLDGAWAGRFTSIALDANDYPHISYYDDSKDRLEYLRWDGVAWEAHNVDETGSAGAYTSIELDSNGHAHISYYDIDDTDLKYAKWTGSAWSVETVDNSGGVGEYTSLELDSLDRPHISYYDAGNKSLKYAKWTGSAWSVETVDSGGNTGYVSSLALDSSDHPHISFAEKTTGFLKYAEWTGSAWNIEFIEYIGIVETGATTSLALDANDYPHISYVYRIMTDLRYATKAPMIPSSPRNLAATPADSQITLNWNPPADIRGSPIVTYRIYRGTVSDGETFLTEIGNVTTYLDSGLTNGQAYYYKVSAVNGVGEGTLSEEVAAVPATVPTAPTISAAETGDGFINLTWEAPAFNGGLPISNYTIHRGMMAGGETFLAEMGNVLYYNDTGVTNGQIYYYKVRAKNSVGPGPLSNEMSATPAAIPSAPVGLVASSGDSFVELSWSPPASDGGSAITDYRIYRGTASGAGTFLVEINNLLEFNDTGVANGITYYYRVSAKNSAGEGDRSEETSATPLGPPTSPQNLEALTGVSFVMITWSAPSYDGGSAITNYRIYRGTVSGGGSLLIELGNVLSYNDTSVTNGITYYYVVSALNAIGEGPVSDEINARPTNQLPLCIVTTPLIGETVSGMFEITGIASDDDGEIQHVEVRIDDGSWILVTGRESWVYAWETTHLSNGLHTIYVKSYDGLNYSTEVSVTAMVDNPTQDRSIFGELWFLMVIVLVVVVVILAISIIVIRRRRGKNAEDDGGGES